MDEESCLVLVHNEEIADILDDGGIEDRNLVHNDDEDDMPPLIKSEDDDMPPLVARADDDEEDKGDGDEPKDSKDPDQLREIDTQLGSKNNEDVIEDAPEICSEDDCWVNERPTRESRPPERYNPSTGSSYLAKVEVVHNITYQVKDAEKTFTYQKGEDKVLLTIMERINSAQLRESPKRNVKLDNMRQKVNAQMFMLGQGLKKFGQDGKIVGKAELDQMHNRTCFRAIVVSELTHQEKLRAVESLMFLSRKETGEIKSRLAYNGKPTQAWIGKEDKASPTVLTKSLMLLTDINAMQGRDVMVMDIPNTFIQTPMSSSKEKVIMKLKGILVDWLLELDYLSYGT